MKYKPGDEVELVGSYLFGGQTYPLHTKRIHEGVNHGVVVPGGVELTVLWDEYKREGGLAVDASCIRLFQGQPLTEAEEREVLESIAHTSDDAFRAELRTRMENLKRLDPELFKEVAGT
jgi:hypothetical protein